MLYHKSRQQADTRGLKKDTLPINLTEPWRLAMEENHSLSLSLWSWQWKPLVSSPSRCPAPLSSSSLQYLKASAVGPWLPLQSFLQSSKDTNSYTKNNYSLQHQCANNDEWYSLLPPVTWTTPGHAYKVCHGAQARTEGWFKWRFPTCC